MKSNLRVALAGWGFMGQMHFGAYKRLEEFGHENVEISHVFSPSARREGGLKTVSGNIAGADEPLDLSGVRVTDDIEEILRDDSVQILDICLPTPLHGDLAARALRAGKHVLCEKPMARTLEECDAMLEAQEGSGTVLAIGHCLRFWAQYLEAHRQIWSGELGEIRAARLFRQSGTPTWSRWLLDPTQSGGAVLDFHIHDVDTALWWFGKPAEIRAVGTAKNGLAHSVDAHWIYPSGPQISLRGAWDNNGSPFEMGFQIIGENGTLDWNSKTGEMMQLFRAGAEPKSIEPPKFSAYDAQIAAFIGQIRGETSESLPSARESRTSVELALETLRQVLEG